MTKLAEATTTLDKTIKEFDEEVNKKKSNAANVQALTRDYRVAREEHINLVATIKLLEYEKKMIPIFHPRDNIKAIRVENVPNNVRGAGRTKRYIAHATTSEDEDHCLELSRVWIEENFTKDFVSEIDDFAEFNSFVCLGPNEGYLYPNSGEGFFNFQKDYKYAPDCNQAHVIAIRVRMEFARNRKKIEEYKGIDANDIEPLEWVEMYPILDDDIELSFKVNGRWYKDDKGSEFDFSKVMKRLSTTINYKEILKNCKAISHRELAFRFQRNLSQITQGNHTLLKAGNWTLSCRRLILPLSDVDYCVHKFGDPEKHQYHFIDIKDQNVFVTVTTKQISMIKYDICKERYFGVEKHSSPPTIVPLQTEWVKTNFTEKQLLAIKAFAAEGKKKFLQCPVEADLEVIPTMDISQNPTVMYQNRGDGICAFAAFASALFYKNFFEEASSIMTFCIDFQENSSDCFRTVQAIYDFVHECEKFKHFRRCYRCEKVAETKNPFQIVENEESMQLLVIRASDNSANHAVSVVGGFIFDSNSKNALPFTVDGMDCCCGPDVKFDSIHYGYIWKTHGAVSEKTKKTLQSELISESIYSNTSNKNNNLEEKHLIEYHDSVGIDNCCSTMACVLYFLNYRIEAKKLIEIGKQLFSKCLWNSACTMCQKMSHMKEFSTFLEGKEYRLEKSKNGFTYSKWFETFGSTKIQLLLLETKDETLIPVGVASGLVFCAKFKRALPCSK